MPINHDEIIEDIEGQIRKCGGHWGEWSVGTAKDSRGPFFQRHRKADIGDGLTYREAYTTTAAEAVVEHLATHRGLTIDRDSVLEPGKIVFVYRPVTHDEAGVNRLSDHKTCSRSPEPRNDAA